MNNPPTVPVLPPNVPSGPSGGGSAGGAVVLLHNDPINILIVDDEAKNLTVLETVLEDPGYRLVRAESADQALLALVAKEFALLILDVRMPVMTGFELAHLIRQRKKTEQVPIIFLTAYYNEDQHVLEGYGTGAVDYLHKPVNPAILRSKVAIFADLYRKTRALEVANRALLAEVTERREAQTQLRELNETLEERVKERTQALRKSDEEKDNFIATLAHELRNPLAPISNAVNLMKRSASSGAQLTWCREVIERQVIQMSRLLEDLLDVSRFTRSKLSLRSDILDVARVIEQAIEIARPWIDKGAQVFEVTLPSSPLAVTGDLTRLSQVISNVLINAAKYTPAEGQIQLTAKQEGDEVVVRVKDSGIGIAPEHITHIFEMFSQIPSATSESQGGLGIGLSLARGLVERHGGRISAYSAGIGRGSEFLIYLPLTIREGLSVSPDAHLTAEVGVIGKCRIMVVDDMRDGADSLAMVLGSKGHEVQVAYDGEQAMRVAEQFRPDMAFIDLGMPNVDGFEVCRRIRGQPWGATMLLVAQTGWGQEFDRRRTSAAGFNQHMVKPLDWAVVDELLRRIAASKSC